MSRTPQKNRYTRKYGSVNSIDDFLFETDNLFDLSIASIKQITSNLSNLQNISISSNIIMPFQTKSCKVMDIEEKINTTE